MKIAAYLSFDNQCEVAFKFYEEVLRGQIVAMMTFAGTPMESQCPPESLNNIAHARLIVDDQVLMGGDAPPNYYQTPRGVTVSIQVAEPAEADRIFQALADGGTITMPIGETFWAHRFGMWSDKFGIPWMINCEKSQ